ncbi:SIR2 family protein [Chloroflexota bacterium]
MEFLKSLFGEELDEDGVVEVAGTLFKRSQILAELEPGDYEQAFYDWCQQRRDRLLERADEILDLHDNRERFSRLKAAFRTGSVIPFIGAGLSVPSGYPAWTTFLRRLRTESNIVEADFEELIAKGEYEEAAQLLYNDSQKIFNEGLVNHFAEDREICGPVQYLPLLFNGTVITTNFDSILKRIYEKNSRSFDLDMFGDDSEEFAAILGRGKRVLLRLHGHCDLVKHRVIIRSEYEAAYSPERLEHLVNGVIFRKSLLFLGCSLAFDRVQRAMEQYVSTNKAGDLVSHFAIAELKDTDDRVARRKSLANSNIFPIWYPAAQHDEAIEALLLKLAEDIVEVL